MKSTTIIRVPFTPQYYGSFFPVVGYLLIILYFISTEAKIEAAHISMGDTTYKAFLDSLDTFQDQDLAKYFISANHLLEKAQMEGNLYYQATAEAAIAHYYLSKANPEKASTYIEQGQTLASSLQDQRLLSHFKELTFIHQSTLDINTLKNSQQIKSILFLILIVLVSLLSISLAIKNRKLRKSEAENNRKMEIIHAKAHEKEADNKKISSLNSLLSNSLKSLSKKKIELQAKNDELEHINARRAKIIDRLTRFAYILSHDTREPIRAITAMGSLLERTAKSKLNDSEKEYLNYMIDGARRMNQMVQVMHSYSNNTLALLSSFQVIYTSKVVKNVLLDLQYPLKEKNAKIEIGKLPSIQGVETMIHQLFQNIISNAVKYAKTNTPPVVQVTSILSGDMHQFSIQDNGQGIDDPNPEQLFALFKRSAKVDNHQEGLGIGLATCKEIVEVHGGEIWLESEYGMGTTVHFTLPKESVD